MVNLTMLVRNRPRLTRQALNSLIATPDCNITVLDDRSDEETVQVLKSYPSMIYALRNEWQIGTGELRNKVINASAAYFGRGDYLYLSDNDVRFTMHWWLELLVSATNAQRNSGSRSWVPTITRTTFR
jgi:glycosyltransferase involved in cell wall biosynthesis